MGNKGSNPSDGRKGSASPTSAVGVSSARAVSTEGTLTDGTSVDATETEVIVSAEEGDVVVEEPIPYVA